MKKAAIIVGTRPEAIKLIPLYLYMKENSQSLGIDVRLISTGQHKEMLDQIFAFFEVRADINLAVMTKNQTLVKLATSLMDALGRTIEELEPDIVIVQGDTNSAMVGGLISFYSKIKVAHVEAGLRTYNRFSPYPEEVNRQIIGSVADFHFAPTQKALDTLVEEKKENVINVGNTVIDSLNLCLEKLNSNRSQYEQKFKHLLGLEKLVLITGHRRENIGSGFDNICQALHELANKYQNMQFVYPVHLNPLIKDKVEERLGHVSNITLLAPLPYDELIFLMSKSYIILTDSGGIQEEAPSLNVPLLVMRDTTERPEGIDAGCAKLVGTDRQVIVDSFDLLVKDPDTYKMMSNVPNPYGDGKTSERIAQYLSKNC